MEPTAWQSSFDDLGRHLSATTFVVLDLETTGGSPGVNSITEIGAQKVQGGKVIGEFQTLVNPGVPIPPFITVLTGISATAIIIMRGLIWTFNHLPGLQFLIVWIVFLSVTAAVITGDESNNGGDQ